MNEELENKTVKVREFEVNGRKYEEFEMRYPTFTELLQNYKAIDGHGEEQMIALFKLVKLCVVTNVKPADFDAFPSYAVFALTHWLGKNLAD